MVWKVFYPDKALPHDRRPDRGPFKYDHRWTTINVVNIEHYAEDDDDELGIFQKPQTSSLQYPRLIFK